MKSFVVILLISSALPMQITSMHHSGYRLLTAQQRGHRRARSHDPYLTQRLLSSQVDGAPAPRIDADPAANMFEQDQQRRELEKKIAKYNAVKKVWFLASLLCTANSVASFFAFSESNRYGTAVAVPPTSNASSIGIRILAPQPTPPPDSLNLNWPAIGEFGGNMLGLFTTLGIGIWSWRQESKAQKQLRRLLEESYDEM